MIKRLYYDLKLNVLKLMIYLQSGTLKTGKNIVIRGFPYMKINGFLEIGNNVIINSSLRSNPTNHYKRCIICVEKNANLKLGDNVGISNSVVYCSESILIQKNTLIGSGVRIWDTDFHNMEIDSCYTNKVRIGENCWIGADSIILKGSNIPNDTIIGANSLVTFSSSPLQSGVYAGNPVSKVK
jgi:acetyltransferase-like isoleucine patch superfamily enzyme